MKHYSAAAIAKSALATDECLRSAIRAQLGFGAGAKAALADRLGIAEASLSKILRGAPVGDAIAAKLGYRRVARFERVE